MLFAGDGVFFHCTSLKNLRLANAGKSRVSAVLSAAGGDSNSGNHCERSVLICTTAAAPGLRSFAFRRIRGEPSILGADASSVMLGTGGRRKSPVRRSMN